MTKEIIYFKKNYGRQTGKLGTPITLKKLKLHRSLIFGILRCKNVKHGHVWKYFFRNTPKFGKFNPRRLKRGLESC